MNAKLLAVLVLVAPVLVACSGSTGSDESEGLHQYSVTVPAGEGDKVAQDLNTKGVSINGQVCYPKTHCFAEHTASGDLVTASMCCPDEPCFVDPAY